MMVINIEYDSCWQNSVLNDKTKPKTSSIREFNKSKPNGNAQPISKSTIFGVLYRLIGEQRTLKKIQNSDHHYFKDIEEKISFSLSDKQTTENELVMLTNKSNHRVGEGKYLGVIKDDTELFFSENAPKLWSVLYLSIDEIINFINNPSLIKIKGSSMPRDILNRLDEILEMPALQTIKRRMSPKIFGIEKQQKNLKTTSDEKKVGRISKTLNKLNVEIEEIKQNKDFISESELFFKTLSSLEKYFSEISKNDFLRKDQDKKPVMELRMMRLYASALYLQADLLETSGLNMSELYVFQEKGLNKGKKVIHGFPKKGSLGFGNVRDFLNKFSTGGDKKAVKTPFLLTKESGKLFISLDVSTDRATKIQEMINNAGVSSFYLGKKGLAYVEDIKVAEIRK